MIPEPPPGQGPIDPRAAFSPPGAPRGPNAPRSFGAVPPPPPPPMYYPPPRFGFRRGIWAVVAAALFALSLVINVVLLIAVIGAFGADIATPTVVVKGDSSNQIAVIPIDEEITGRTEARISKLLRQLKDDSSLKAIVIELNTPGGEVTASDEIYDALLKFKDEKKIPIVINMRGLATSGGYYIACAGDYLVAEPTSITANIGVVLERFNFSGLLDKYGVKDTSITPAGAKYKNVESPFVPDTPETQAYLRQSVDQEYARFKFIVGQSRKGKLTATVDVVADGRALSADDAKKLGLIDEINYADAAYAKASALAGISGAQVVRYDRGIGFFEMLGGASSHLGGAKATSVDHLPDVRIDRQLLDEITRPRLMSITR